MDINEKYPEEYPNFYVPNWFGKVHFEDILDLKLTGKQFQKIKEYLKNSNIDDKISGVMKEYLFKLKEDKPELFKE